MSGGGAGEGDGSGGPSRDGDGVAVGAGGGGGVRGGWVRRGIGWAARSRFVRVYLLLLLASHVVIAVWNPRFVMDAMSGGAPEGAERVFVEVGERARDGSLDAGGGRVRLALWRWGASEGVRAQRWPVVLVHGSPSGGGAEFEAWASRLASAGFEVYALDRPGYGASESWVRSYSLRANAGYVLGAMDALGIERAHVAGFSQGGGAAIWCAAMSPSRIASLTLLSSVGMQEGEGSGDYFFEHAKYALGYVGVVLVPELVPHFNALGARSVRHAFVRDFWDTDQRPIRGVLEGLDVPTLIVHGRDDPLVPAWVSEEHHRAVGPSRLLMLDDSHFFVLGPGMSRGDGFEQGVRAHAGFAARHDALGVPVRVGVADFAPWDGAASQTIAGYEVSTRTTRWWLAVLIIALGTLVSEDLTVIITTLLVVNGQLDLGVGFIGLMVGILAGDIGLWLLGRVFGRRLLRIRFFRKRIPEKTLEHWSKMLDAHTAKAVFLSRCLPGTRLPTYVAAGMLGRRAWAFLFWFVVAVLIWTPLLMGLTALVGPPILSFFQDIFHAPVAIVVSLLILLGLVKLVSYEVTPSGRKLLRSDLRRWLHREFWPMWAIYAPLVPWLVYQSVRNGGALVFTCANPGIDHGGGVVGESKHAILEGLSRARERAGLGEDEVRVLHSELIPAEGSAEERARRALNLIDADPRFGGFPVVLKPDASQRGTGMKVARSSADVERYFEIMRCPVQVQRFHPGEREAGILWSRVPSRGLSGADGSGDGNGSGVELPGHIFSITVKSFPEIEGDGERSIERLIWDHPRYSLQARTFLARFEDRLEEVPGVGERIRLAQAGNHAQGTMFTDGSALITPELTVVIDRLSRAFEPDERGVGGLDFGRFDVRYERDEDLMGGRGLAIVELNGTLSESTNLYDPGKSLRWSYGVLFSQWRRVYELGRMRRARGQRAVGMMEMVRMVMKEGSGASAVPVAD
ncbi:MAG: alpha/beta fold hydrolase [Phycisphaerales bacterium]